MRRRGERDVAFAGQQSRGRIEPDPARARNEHLGPGVEVGAVLRWPGRPVERDDVGLELNEIAGDEARRQAEMAQRLHQQPRAVAAGAGAGVERFLRRLNARLHAHHIADAALDLGIEVDEKLDRADRAFRDLAKKRAQLWAERFEIEIAAKLMREIGRQRERISRRIGLDEKVERIDRHQVCMEIDRDGELGRTLRKRIAGDPVAVRVVLPVHVVLGRNDLERIARDARAPMRRGAQADHLRAERDRPVVGDSA